MPRGPRLDAPGTLHHVMVRGIERRPIFRDDRDRADFLARLGVLVAQKARAVYAWALLPHHGHVLVRTGQRPLARTMGALLAGYAGAFNRRHQRHGHLFQNRYKSIVVEEEPYLLELTRYIHLNPLRAGLVRDLAALDRYPWSGHRGIVGRCPYPWQAVGAIVGQFGGGVKVARRRYRKFVAAGVARGRRPELQGGGLHRSAGGWEALGALQRGRERWAFDERVLDSGAFGAQLLAAIGPPAPASPARARRALAPLIARLAARFAVPAAALTGGARRRPLPTARAVVCALACTDLGLPAAAVARALGVSGPAVLQAIPRGQAQMAAQPAAFQALVRAVLRGGH